jgi:flagellar biosynthesis/type III secretory pathway M-ring protein FliF/YscJ
MLPSNDLPLPKIEWTREKGGKRAVSRAKKIIFIGLLAWALTFPIVLCPGQEKQENTSKKETPKKSMSESAKGKVQEEWQKAKKDTKEAGQELKRTGKQFSDSAKKESKKMGEALKKAGKALGESLHEIFKGLKKLFKE